MNKRYENELKKIAEPRDAYVAFNMEVRNESFETKLAKIEDEIRKMLTDGVTQLRLGVIVREITLAELNQLIELRKKYPKIAAVVFCSSVSMQENPEQIASAVNNLAAGLLGLELNIIPPPEGAEAEFSFAENTLQQCFHALSIHPELRELTINGPIDEPTATKIGNALRDNQGLQHLSISVRDDSCLTILSDSLQVNTTLLKLILNQVSQSKQDVINICKALHAHPTLTHLNMGDIEIDENILHSVLVLLNANPSIKELHFNVTNPFSEELFIAFCAALEKNTSLRELRLRPNPFTVHCAQALSQLLTRNRGLKVFSFDSNDIFPIQASTAAINELLKHLPDYHVAVSFTKKVLHALQTGKDENYDGSFVDLIGAERPLSYAILIKIVENIIICCKDPKFVAPANFNMALIDQLQAVLNDKSISYIERFNLLRTHPEVKAELLRRYGTYRVVCFEELILNKGQNISYDTSVGWDQAYQAYHQAKQLVLAVDKSHVEVNDFTELAAIKRKFKECYDILCLTEETRATTQNNEVFRNRLISLSTNVPIISAFLGTLFLQLKDTAKASKYYLQAATQGNFSQIKILRKAAKKGEAWAIEVLSQEPFIRQYPQMWLFLGSCYMRRGDTDQALVYYQKSKPMIPEGFKLMGDCYIKRNEIKLAIDCYRQADPLNNEEACHALEYIADGYRDVPVILILADIYRRKTHHLPDDKTTLMYALRYNFKAGKANNDDANHFLAVKLANQHIIPQLYAIALQLEENNDDLELAKQLYVISQRTHPIARLELMRLNHPPIMTIKEKVFNEKPQLYCDIVRKYFADFLETNSLDTMPSSQSDNRDVATTICRHLHAHPTLSPQEILTWLREKAINNNQRVSGEFARMFCCAIVQLKLWSARVAEHKPIVSPSNPPTRSP